MKTATLIAAILAGLLTGCSTIGNRSSATVYNQGETQREIQRYRAVVIDVKDAVIDQSGGGVTMLGQVIGGSVGAAAGAQLGKSGSITRVAGTVAGGGAGAIAGGAATRLLTDVNAYEVHLRVPGGRETVIVQDRSVQLTAGMCVDVTVSRSKSRVTPARSC